MHKALLPVALAGALLAAQPAAAAVASVTNGSGAIVHFDFDGDSYVIAPNYGADYPVDPPHVVKAHVTFPDGHGYDAVLDFTAVPVITADQDGVQLWCVDIGTEATWIEDADECDFYVNGP